MSTTYCDEPGIYTDPNGRQYLVKCEREKGHDGAHKRYLFATDRWLTNLEWDERGGAARWLGT